MNLLRFGALFSSVLVATVWYGSTAVSAQPAQTQPAAKPAPAKPATRAAAKPAAASPATGATLLGQFGDWGAYTAAPGGRKVCFALSKPTKSQIIPPDRKRDQAYLFVSTRPSEKVKEEISLMFGYPLKPNAEPSADIGPASFALYSQNDGAWIKNAADETKMIETMRKSGDMVVKGESPRGTKTLDTYSLIGISQALDKIAQECP